METNLELWNKVGTTGTDTKTKEVSYGSRKFTAIDAYSQIKTATGEFGKYGEKWGFKEVKYDIVEGRIYFIGTFYYINKDKTFGEFPIFNDAKVGDDGAKKVFTDSLTKALSYLGFNADVFMGKFDGNKYTGKKEDIKDDNKPWFDDVAYDKLSDLIDKGQIYTIKQVREKYKVSKANAEKLKSLGIN